MGSRQFSRAFVGLCVISLLAVACGTTKKATPKNTNPALPGITATTIKVGLWWVDSSGTCAKTKITSPTAACGAGDETQFKQLTTYVNAHGGMAGRQMDGIIYHTSFAGPPLSVSAQQACTYFTQDNPVYAVIAQNSIPGEDAACFAQHHVIVIDPSTYPHDNDDFVALAPYLYAPSRPRPERWLKAYVDGLFSQHFFDGNVKIGLVRYTYPQSDKMTETVLKPALAAHNLTITDEAKISPPAGVSSLGDLQTTIGADVLKFKTAGINRVLFFTDIGVVDLFWYPVAASQKYFPRYGLSSTQQMSVFVDMAPKGTFKGALGVGWDPFFDVKPAQDPGSTPATELCKSVVTDPKDNPVGRDNKCATVLFLKTALDKALAMGDVTPQGIRKAVAALGTSYQENDVFSTKFGPGLYDGPASYRIYSFVDSCSCFQYTGPETPMPEDPVPGLS